MITSRAFDTEDVAVLSEALATDGSHAGTTVDFFTQPGSVCNVYEDEEGPILFVRGIKSLRLDIQYLDNKDVRRNMVAMMDGFPPLAAKAKENGFSEIIFNTASPMLKRFCLKRLGFEEIEGDELRKLL